MNNFNPYRRNCEVMRKFFAKPIFLITGIVISIYVITNAVLSLLSNQTMYCDFISVAMCVAFFVFYFKARSKKEYVSFRAPTVLMDVVSIVGIVFSGLIFVFSGFMTVLFMLPTKSADIEYHGSYEFLWSTLGKAVHELAVIFFPIVAVLSLLFLLYFIGMQRMTLSFKKSLSNIYLQKKGALMFAVSSVILAIIVSVCYTGLIAIPYIGVNNLFNNMTNGLDVRSIIIFSELLLMFILSAILGFSYNSYINKLAYSLKTSKPTNQNVSQTIDKAEETSPVKIWQESENENQAKASEAVTRPVEFTPQPVFARNKEDFKENADKAEAPENNTQNPYNPYNKNKATQAKRCAKCGAENPNTNVFCGSCGAKL